MKIPKVVVIMATYNHEKTVEKAVQSVLSQTDREGNPFPLGLLITDDCSTDGTQNIINKYESIEGVFLVKHPINYGMIVNYYAAISCVCSIGCKYIAFCDGDDYWTNSLKLQRQLEYMEENPDCSLCITKVKIQDEDSDKLIEMVDADYVNRVISFDSILRGNAHIHAQSYFLRVEHFVEYVNVLEFIKHNFKLWDIPIVLELIKKGKIHCLDFYSAVFYKQKESVTNTRSRKKRFKYILIVNKIKRYFVRKYGCKLSTRLYLAYRFIRDIYSIIFRRWYR